ncbi:MAG: ATP-grasp domain-containing protein [Planctomycetota bacterium]
MRVLLTSPRAPVTLDLARRLNTQGNNVFVCDSLRFALGAFSRGCSFLRVPRAMDSPQGYVACLEEIVQQHQIDWLIPTCEEVFAIAAYQSQLSCNILVDSIDKLRNIHDKWTFSQNASNEFASVPESQRLVSLECVESYRETSGQFVFKPCFSRFASETMISPTFEALKTIDISTSKPWIAQRRVRGIEYSTYSVARHGKLLAHSCYTSSYRAGTGSGIYFVPQEQSQILNFVTKFIEQFQYTGQIGFDCIVDEAEVAWILEGNPRATSGLHLFSEDQPLSDAILGTHSDLIYAPVKRPVMLAAAMPIWGLAQAIKRIAPFQFLADLLRARGILFRWRDPLPALMLPVTIAELMQLAVREKASLQQVSTLDIEWNGEKL